MDRPIAIGIDARFLLRPLRGIPLYVERLCSLLPPLERSFAYVLFINKRYEHNDLESNYAPRLEKIAANPNVRIVNRDDEGETKWEQLYLPRLVKEHDIRLLHMPANRFCFNAGVPTVITVHDMMEYLYLKQNFLSSIKSGWYHPKRAAYLIRRFGYKYLNIQQGYKRASRVITVSRYSASDIERHLGISSEVIRPIHHGADEVFFGGESSGARDGGSGNYVLMFGGDSRHKNPEGAIAAWAQVPKSLRAKYPLRIIGFCGNEESPLLSAIRLHGLTDEVQVKGWVTQEEMIENMKNATLFLYLSRYEGFGLPLLHAMAAGTPVISTDVASIPEVVEDRELLYHPDDNRGIAAAIERLLSDQALYLSKVRAGKERARLFNWRRSAELHLDVYREVLRDV